MYNLAMFDYIDLLLVMGFAWTLTGIAGLAFRKKTASDSSLFGVLILVIFALTLADNFVKPGMLPPAILRLFYIPARNAYFLVGPAIWFYTRSLLEPGKKLRPSAALHLLPFIIWCAITLVKPFTALPMPSGTAPVYPRPVLLMQARDLSAIVSRLAYSIFVLSSLLRHRREAPNYYSSIGFRTTISWLTLLVLVYALIYTVDGLLFLVPPPVGRLKVTSAMLTRIVPSLLFIFLFSILARDQEIPEDRKQEGQKQPDAEKYRTSSLGKDEAQEIFDRLNAYIEKNRAFTDPGLTLDSLAEETGETRHRLSESINRISGESFYNLINSYRLKDFLACCSENRYPEYTILAAAFECGFKSASAFYTVFRKATGKTPKQYLKDNNLN